MSKNEKSINGAETQPQKKQWTKEEIDNRIEIDLRAIGALLNIVHGNPTVRAAIVEELYNQGNQPKPVE